MKVLIGSTVIKKYYPDFPRIPKDIDYAVDKYIKNEDGIEYLLNPIICSMYANGGEINLNHLLTLKVSHLFWDINWEKHMFDVQFLLSKGLKIDIDLFYKLYEYWNTYHNKNKRSDLKMTSKDFFNNALKCEYSHDWLHTLLKNPPTFMLVLKDGAEVDVCEDKFNALSFQQKCDLVFEEVAIMGFERYSHLYYKTAYSKMLKKFIISHAPLWEALFIIENYKLLLIPKFNFLQFLTNKIHEHNTVK